MMQQPRTGYHTYVGVFTIISICILIILTAFYALQMGQYTPYPLFYEIFSITLRFAVYTIGLVGGIMSIFRRNFVFAVVGVSLILWTSVFQLEGAVLGLSFILAGGSTNYPSIHFPLSIVATVLSFLAIVYLARAKAEFDSFA